MATLDWVEMASIPCSVHMKQFYIKILSSSLGRPLDIHSGLFELSYDHTVMYRKEVLDLLGK